MSWQGAVETTVKGLGYELVDAEKSAGGLLRVYIDHGERSAVAAARMNPAGEPGATPFITVDDCEKVTRQLQHVLEVEGCAYARLEVSSPGLDRPLKKAADYERFSGELVELTLKLPFNGRKKYRGELAAREGGWRLVLREDGRPDQALDFSLEEVREARLVPVVDFKGRRFAPRPAAPQDRTADEAVLAGKEVDGGRIQ
jgi:ribosome maturation factor RimP